MHDKQGMRVAFCGDIGSGKSTLAKALVEHLAKEHLPAVRLSFAEALRTRFAADYALSVELYGGAPLDAINAGLQIAAATEAEGSKEAYREPLRKIGTTPIVGQVGMGIYMARTIDRMPPCISLVVDDLRTYIQAHVLRERGFLLFRLSGPEAKPDPVDESIPVDAGVIWLPIDERVRRVLALYAGYQKPEHSIKAHKHSGV